MRLVFYSNYLNIHQVHIADELYALLGDEFRFVATMPRNAGELKGGIDYSSRPYCILAAESTDAQEEAIRLAVNAEVCVLGACSQEYAIVRATQNPSGLSFEMGERWLKHGWLTIGSPVFRQWAWNYYRFYRKANFYKLCCSAFTARDDERLYAYHGRHYKWGYFTEVPENLEPVKPLEVLARRSQPRAQVRLMWCARFIDWKHPELPIRLAAMLKRSGYDVHLDMYGDGNMRPAMEQLSKELNIVDFIAFHGNIPNSEIHLAMRNHDIFLFTSDRGEGWGAVANEALSEGCLLIGADEIGAVPYLVKHKETGMIFRSCDLDSLYEQVKYLLDNPDVCKQISKAGQESIIKLWNPENAAKSLLQLIEDIQAGRECTIAEGPCSIAL